MMSPRSGVSRELIERIVALACAQTPAGERALVETFVRECFGSKSREALAETAPEPSVAAALSLFSWARSRQPPEGVALRIFDPAEGDPTAGPRTVVEIVNDDRPFLVDSLVGELARRELTVHHALHPVVAVSRGEDGVLHDLASPAGGGKEMPRESWMRFEIDRQASPAARVELETELHRVLSDLRRVVEDFPLMREICEGIEGDLSRAAGAVPPVEIAETQEFLRWIRSDHFTFLGYLQHELVVIEGTEYLRPVADTGLGILRELPLADRARGDRPLPAEESDFLHGEHLVSIAKASRRATVHRPVHMDVVSIRRFDEGGELVGADRFLGLFTSRAYSIGAFEIPLVKSKVARVMERTGFAPTSYNARTLRHIVEHYSRDELFQTSDDDLYEAALRILDLRLRPRPAILLRRDHRDRFISCLVFVPRDRHSTGLRLRIERLLEEAFAGQVTASYTRIDDRPLAQLQLVVKTRPGHVPDFRAEDIEAGLVEIVRSWTDHLKHALRSADIEAPGVDLWRRYREAFPLSYQEYFRSAEAIADIRQIEAVLAAETDFGLRLQRRAGASADRFQVRTFERAVPAPLSRFLPPLENMGLTIERELPFETRPLDAAHPVWVRDFEVVAESEVDLEAVGESFVDALVRIWEGEVDDDGFNRLVLAAGLTARQIVVLRAYCKYLLQIGVAFSQRYMERTLARNGDIARDLIELFTAYFDPAPDDGREAATEEIRRRLQRRLDAVDSLDEDRILRRFLNLVESTLRTNFFQTAAGGEAKAYLALKLDAEKVRGLPRPRPRFETFVFSSRLEAVHLRGGKVARGGIRWSDRREDFRTEILDLVKSQTVKNAVIVPVGAKGGFVLKRPPAEREALLAEGVECYKTMIRGLLDLVDNLVEGEVVTPSGTVRRDDDDTYLVVAADKGTASFSDTANQVAAEYDFWLGDAFASGGSRGYDHKGMGITARGAWESVKRHFRELGRDIQSEDFTVVGVGDMAGDVFGNGMLLSEHIRLVAAFNHLHIFVDPDPDAATSYAERRRLFELPRSSWTDYDRELLSPGGEIFDRSAKEITVSAEVRELFGLSADSVAPAELIRAILRASVDLVWFGGIGTYVKASWESHARAGDRANNELRVDASELACKVVGEGANLGLTGAARVELAAKGGRLNTDFIDNSGGVDCSDHEVNIKIALREAVRVGALAAEEREGLLAEMTAEVADLVLRNNYLQTQALSVAAAQGAELLDAQARLIRELERAGKLDRRIAGLPDETALAERLESNTGLTRPELAALFALAKIDLFDALLASDLPESPSFAGDLKRYFPKPMQKRFAAQIGDHRLRREILATQAANSLVNRLGATFTSRVQADTGADVADIARAYLAARDVFDLRSLWDGIEALDNHVSAELQLRMMVETIRLVERAARWFLRYSGQPPDIAACLDENEADIVVVAAQIEDLLPAKSRQRVRGKYRRLTNRGVPKDVARRVATANIVHSACDVARCAKASGVQVERVGRIYFAVGERLGFDRLRRAAAAMPSASAWQRAAVSANIDDLFRHQAELTRQVVDHPGRANAAIAAWLGDRHGSPVRVDRLIEDLETGAKLDLAMLTVAERELRRLAGG